MRLGARMEQNLWIQALRFVPLAAASLSLTILSVWGRMTMQRTWREWLSNHLYDFGWKMITMFGSDSWPETIKLPNTGSLKMRGLRQTCLLTLCSDYSHQSSPR